MLRAEEARTLCANWDAKRIEEAKKKANEMLNLLSEAIAKNAANGKHSFNCEWSVAWWGSEKARDFGEEAIREAGYTMKVSGSTCLITW